MAMHAHEKGHMPSDQNFAALQNNPCGEARLAINCAVQQLWSLTGLFAFLDVSSLNLAVLRHRLFFRQSRDSAQCGEGGFGGEGFDQCADVALQGGESGQALDPGLIHVEIAGNFDL